MASASRSPSSREMRVIRSSPGSQASTRRSPCRSVNPTSGKARGEARDAVRDVPHLGARALHELQAHRGVVEEIPDLDPRAPRTSIRPHLLLLPSPVAQPVAARGPPRSRPDDHVGHGADRRQRLAPEPERRDLEEVLHVADLARRVRGEREAEVLEVHPLPVVHDPDELATAFLHLDEDALRPRVERVLDQLLHHRGGSLDDLPRGDLVHDVLGQQPDHAHRFIPSLGAGAARTSPPGTRAGRSRRRPAPGPS
jgi:hypothetical protein